MRNGLQQAKRFISVLIVAFLCSIGSPVLWAQAQDAGQPPAGNAKEETQLTKDTPGWMEARLAKIHRKLHITSEQEAAWNEYAKGMRETAESMQPLYERYYHEQHTMNAVENMRLYMEMSEAHARVQKVLIPLFEKLYNGFSDKQKRIADEFFADQPKAGHVKK